MSIRQQPYFFRETPDREHARDLPRRIVLSLLLSGSVGLLLAHTGAFDTSHTPVAVRYGYFGGLCVAGGLLAAMLLEVAERGRLGRLPTPARLFLVVTLISVLLTPLVWLAAALVLGGDTSPMRLIPLAGQVAPVAALLVPFMQLADQSKAVEPQPSHDEPDATSALLNRLPVELRSAGLVAIGAEDHYLRIHTTAGSALILMRLSDALRAVETIDGAQTHRSWWVARAAVLGARRGDGRATLSLANGVEVPVSRRHARRLRQLGWF